MCSIQLTCLSSCVLFNLPVIVCSGPAHRERRHGGLPGHGGVFQQQVCRSLHQQGPHLDGFLRPHGERLAWRELSWPVKKKGGWGGGGRDNDCVQVIWLNPFWDGAECVGTSDVVVRKSRVFFLLAVWSSLFGLVSYYSSAWNGCKEYDLKYKSHWDWKYLWCTISFISCQHYWCFLHAHFPHFDLFHCRQSLWTVIVDSYYGQSLWTVIVDSHCSQSLWTVLVDSHSVIVDSHCFSHYGQSLWTVIVDSHCGQSLWTVIADSHYGQSLWTVIMDSHSVIVDSHCGQSLWTVIQSLWTVIQSLWTVIVDSHYGQSLRTVIVDSHCGQSLWTVIPSLWTVIQSLWTVIADSHYGQSLWTVIVDGHCGQSFSHCGQSLWTVIMDSHSVIVDSHCGQSLRTVIVDSHCGRSLWTVIMDSHYGQSLWTGIVDSFRIIQSLWTVIMDWHSVIVDSHCGQSLHRTVFVDSQAKTCQSLRTGIATATQAPHWAGCHGHTWPHIGQWLIMFSVQNRFGEFETKTAVKPQQLAWWVEAHGDFCMHCKGAVTITSALARGFLHAQ